LLALEVLLSTVKAEKYIQHHYPGLSPYIEVLYMPFVEGTKSIFSWSSLILTIPKTSRKFGGTKVLLQFREHSVYLRVEDKELADYLDLPSTDVMIQPKLADFDYVPPYNL
jgi:hypothetical protein